MGPFLLRMRTGVLSLQVYAARVLGPGAVAGRTRLASFRRGTSKEDGVLEVPERDQALLLSRVGCFAPLFPSRSWSSTSAACVYAGKRSFQLLRFLLRDIATRRPRGLLLGGVVCSRRGAQCMAASNDLGDSG